MKKKIIFSAGGSGGHIFPALNLMKYFSRKGYEVLLFTDDRGKNFILNSAEFKSYVLKVSTPTNKNFLKKIIAYFTIIYSIAQSFIFLKREKPNLVFGLGGYVSFPICFASKFLNLPMVIYENNMILGRANKYLSLFAKKILLSKKIKKNFPKKYNIKSYEVGTILDEKLINLKVLAKKNFKKNFSILVIGGSQGAEVFGKIIPPVIKMIKDAGYEIEVMQQCILGQKNFLEDFYNKNNIKNYIFEFDKNILDLMSSASLALTRCGASSTAELAFTLTPFIGVPLPGSIDNHQYLNGEYYQNQGCSWLLEQDNLSVENLFNLIVETIKDKNKLENARKNMKKNYKGDVYMDIEKKIKEFI